MTDVVVVAVGKKEGNVQDGFAMGQWQLEKRKPLC